MQRIGKDCFPLKREKNNKRKQQSDDGYFIEFVNKDIVEIINASFPNYTYTCHDTCCQRNNNKQQDREQQSSPRNSDSAHTKQQRYDRGESYQYNQIIHSYLYQRIGSVSFRQITPYKNHRRARSSSKQHSSRQILIREVGRYTLPRNSIVTGEGRIQGERLGIEIIQVEHGGVIIPVELTVYDNDGQDGIFIPGSMEANAVREVAANLGQNLGTSISITNQSAKDQLLSELGRGAIQGVSQYISRKMREEKVHLKSGYTLMLYQKENQ